jgi:hypothetical protein
VNPVTISAKISGVKANIAKWNEKLAIDLEEAIATLQTNMNIIQLGNNHNSTSENKNHDEKCGKCNRNCSETHITRITTILYRIITSLTSLFEFFY